MSPRRRIAVATASTGWCLVTLAVGAAPALALGTPNGQNGSTAPISTVSTVLLFIAVPVAVMVIGALFTLPARAVGALRYRPGRPWGFDREWFGTQPDPVIGDVPLADPGAAPVVQAGGAHADW